MVHGRIDDLAESETEEDPLLHPGVDTPADGGGGIRFSGAHATGGELLAQPRKGGTCRVPIGRRAGGHQIVDVVFEHLDVANRSRP